MSRASWFLGAWAGAVIVVGAALTSFHQPFLVPKADALQLALAKGFTGGNPAAGRWQATHLLSSGCGCSRRVMLHLLQRRSGEDVSEQIVLIHGDELALPGTDKVVSSLKASGFRVSDFSDRELEASSGVRGVPLLLITSPAGKVVYAGGYGAAGDQDEVILRRVRSGQALTALPVLGCAIGRRAKRSSDPFRMKY